MPEHPPEKRRPLSPAASPRDTPAVSYAELRCRTNFSFLEGASHSDELVHRAAELGYRALAIADRNSVAGVVRAHAAAKTTGLKLLIGAEVTPADAPPAVLLATDRAAYGRLCRLLTTGRRRAAKGNCELTFDDVASHTEGLLACVPMGNPKSEIRNPKEIRSTNFGISSDADRDVSNIRASSFDIPSDFGFRVSDFLLYRNLFGDRCYALAELHRGPDDRRLLQRMIETAQTAGVPLAAANDVHYHVRDRRFLQDVLTAIRHGCTVAELGDRRFPNAERRLKSPAEMAALFAEYPAAVARTVEIADRCTFSLDELRYQYPEELCPPEITPFDYLQRLTWDGAHRRYPQGVPAKVRRLVEHELQLIEELRYEAYFLTVWDLVRFARSRDILCQGRGSAANSAVCYCLEITSVDPDRIDVLFERFVSRERDEAPDIDVDFEHERREEVIQYVYEKYGRERAGMAATVITYRPRSAVRDVGKALGLSLDRVDAVAKSLERANGEDTLPGRLRHSGLNPASTVGRQLRELVRQILGFPRHLSQHVGGLVLTQGPLCEMVPIENAAMPGRTVIQWDKDDLDALGILKVDCLALGMLTAIRKCFALIERHRLWVGVSGVVSGGVVSGEWSSGEGSRPPGNIGRSTQYPVPGTQGLARDSHVPATPAPDTGAPPVADAPGSRESAIRNPQSAISLSDIPPEDPRVYEMVSRADTIGVFQIESRAQMSMLPRLRPECFYDLVIEVAIVRPGPIQGDMVHPYLRRRSGEEPVEFPDDRIRDVLEKTLGVPIFQEQAMRLAVVAAGFTPGEADQLRRAMGAWRRQGVIDRFRQKLIDGMRDNGYGVDFAERLFKQIRGFGEYGFPESHAASFALLVYVSAWLKRYHPAAFTAALLNSQPMGFYAPAQLVADARKHGVDVRPVDVNHSDWDCTLEVASGGVVSGEWWSGESPRKRPGEPILSTRYPVRGTQYPVHETGPSDSSPVADAPGSPSSSHPSSHKHSPLTTHHSLPALRLGLRMVRGLSQSAVEKILAARNADPFESFDDFTRRTRLSSAVLKTLSRADAFCSLDLDRRAALWRSLEEQDPLPLFDDVPGEEPPVALPAMSRQEQVVADYQSGGLSLRGHPIEFLRPMLAECNVTPAEKLAVVPAERYYKVAGLVLLRQRPSTAKGITFVTLEDETGTVNLIIRQDVWERHRPIAAGAGAMIAHGRLQRQHEVIHILVHRLQDLSRELSTVDVRSRDFR